MKPARFERYKFHLPCRHGGTIENVIGLPDAWNHIPTDKDGTLEYLTMGRMYLCKHRNLECAGCHDFGCMLCSAFANLSLVCRLRATCVSWNVALVAEDDGTYHKPTTMGWLGFELSRTPPPMDTHLDVLELAAASYLGQGNVPCYRGHLLFDANSTDVRRMWSLWTAH